MEVKLAKSLSAYLCHPQCILPLFSVVKQTWQEDTGLTGEMGPEYLPALLNGYCQLISVVK